MVLAYTAARTIGSVLESPVGFSHFAELSLAAHVVVELLLFSTVESGKDDVPLAASACRANATCPAIDLPVNSKTLRA